jgi:hypothetical protein
MSADRARSPAKPILVGDSTTKFEPQSIQSYVQTKKPEPQPVDWVAVLVLSMLHFGKTASLFLDMETTCTGLA